MRNPHTAIASIVTFAALAMALAATPASAEVKKSIAVAPIEWAGGAVSWISGEALHAQMITELNKTGRYRVVERENLSGILNEQDLAASGRMRKGSGPKSGDLEGAQMMIKCVITDAEEESGKGGRIGLGPVNLGGKKTIYRVTMDVRTYDTQTGIMVNTETVTTEMKKGAAGGGISLGPVSLGGDQSGGDTTGAITRELIKEALAIIDKQSKKLDWKSNVHGTSDGKAIIIGGKRDGLEPGMTFDLYRLGEPVLDDDGAVLDAGEETKVGELNVSSVKEKVSYCQSVSGEAPEKGMIVKLRK